MGRLHSLDGLRALAVMLVFAHHINQHTLPGGFVGVDVFFVISGYLITYLLLGEREATGAVSFRRFYARRALRLYPALIVMVIVVTPFAMHDGIGRPTKDATGALVYIMDFWANYSPHLSLLLHTWSLSVEEQFYLVWPAILLLAVARSWPLRRVVVGLIAGSVVVTFAVHAAHIGRLSNVQYLPTSHVAELGSGILLAIVAQGQPPDWVRGLSGTVPAACALVLLLVGEFVLPADWWAFPAATVACWPVVAHLVLHRDSVISGAFSRRLAVWLGERSYGFYLWHYPVLVLLARSTTSWEKAAIGLPITLAATAVSWRWVEQPFLRLKQRTVARPATRAEVSIN